jgi:hypothetical protein
MALKVSCVRPSTAGLVPPSRYQRTTLQNTSKYMHALDLRVQGDQRSLCLDWSVSRPPSRVHQHPHQRKRMVCAKRCRCSMEKTDIPRCWLPISWLRRG